MLMTILLRLIHKQPAAPRRPDEPVVDPETAEDRPLGCGWFDSSHELQCGLVVTEHVSADAVASDLPLSDWLGLTLGGWRVQPAAEPGLT